MKIIKLDATDSTNDFLMGLVRSHNVDNFTVVYAKNQTKGKGQMGAKWQSEEGKNLTISVLVKDLIENVTQIYVLNIAIALAILEVLKTYKIPNLTIKWPNDIMAGSKKIGGILIENCIKSDKKIESIVGIGLNANQINFIGLPSATSMAVLLNKEINLEQIISQIVAEIKINYQIILDKMYDDLWQMYHQNLFKINVIMPFENSKNLLFMAVVKGVSKIGQLELLTDSGEVKVFDVKEIKMLF